MSWTLVSDDSGFDWVWKAFHLLLDGRVGRSIDARHGEGDWLCIMLLRRMLGILQEKYQCRVTPTKNVKQSRKFLCSKVVAGENVVDVREWWSDSKELRRRASR